MLVEELLWVEEEAGPAAGFVTLPRVEHACVADELQERADARRMWQARTAVPTWLRKELPSAVCDCESPYLADRLFVILSPALSQNGYGYIYIYIYIYIHMCVFYAFL